MRPKNQQWRLGVGLLVGLLFVSFAGGGGTQSDLSIGQLAAVRAMEYWFW
jgi:hypothetical protein